MKLLIIIICAALTRLLVPTSLRANTNEVILPIQWLENRVLVSVQIQETNTFQFMLDSAYTISTISPGAAKKLGLQSSGSVVIAGIAGEERVPTYKGLTFHLNGINYSPSRVAEVKGRGRDGILGSGFFRRNVLEIRPKEKILKIHRPENFAYQGKGEIIPFKMKSEIPIISARLRLPDQTWTEAEFEIDTGCDSAICIGKHFIPKLQFADKEGKSDNRKYGVGGSVGTQSSQFEEFQIGSMVLNKVPVELFLDGTPVEPPLAGHIGMGLLRDFNLIFDYSRKRIILEK